MNVLDELKKYKKPTKIKLAKANSVYTELFTETTE